MSTDANGQPASADYAYDETADGGGDMVFDVERQRRRHRGRGERRRALALARDGAGRGDCAHRGR